MADNQLKQVSLSRDLVSQMTYDDIFSAYQEAIEAPLEAAQFYKSLEPLVEAQSTKLEQQAPDMASKYKKMLFQAAVVGLPYLQDKIVLQILSEYPLNIVRAGYKLKESVSKFLAGHYLLEDRNNLRLKIRALLENCAQPLGSNASKASKDQPRTVGEWIRYRNTKLGHVTESDLVSEKQFLAQDRYVRSLSDKEQSELAELLSLYRWLHLSSLWQEGFEESIVIKEDGRLKILHNGILEDITLNVKADNVGNSSKKNSITTIPETSQINKFLTFPDTEIPSKEAEPVTKPVTLVSKTPEETKDIMTPHSIVTTSQAMKVPGPAFIIDIEDENEVDAHRSKFERSHTLEEILRQYVQEFISKNNLVFKDEVNKRRFIQLMVSRLKDVRGPLEVAEVLRKPSEAGGLGMTEEKADQVQAIIEQAKKEFELRIKHNELQIPEPIPEPVAPPAPAKIEPPKPAFDAEAAKQWRDQMLRQLQEQNQPVTPPDQTTAPPAAVMPKPQLSDVKAPPKVVGPLEELRSLTLVDFRRLGATPLEALQKIKGKIDLLGESSIGRRVEAVRAWKSSVVYQQYLRLGRESIEQGKSISDIVNAHQMAGDPVLTEQEFTAIADFNAKLRF